jgi:hypothetical protein
MRKLMETQDPAQLSWVVALLTAEDIDFQVFDSHVSSLFGSSVMMIPRRVMVAEADFARAKRLLDAAIEAGPA